MDTNTNTWSKSNCDLKEEETCPPQILSSTQNGNTSIFRISHLHSFWARKVGNSIHINSDLLDDKERRENGH